MSENNPMCYEKCYCYFCRVKNCDKRIGRPGFATTDFERCDGNCFECTKAVRSSFYHKLYELKGFGENFRGCLMYYYVAEMKNFVFYGKTGKDSPYSKQEMVILQLKKCSECEKHQKYLKTLEDVASKLDIIPTCFESMTDLTSSKVLQNIKYEISRVVNNNFSCKEKTVIKRLIKEFLTSNEYENVDLSSLCDYITKNQIGLNYYVHPLTIEPILEEFVLEIK